jgi:ParB/RepB/Spo0J family partition protein
MPASPELNAQFQSREIPIELLDEPAVPERETMEEVDLAELALSIANDGLINPLTVKAVNERFEVTAGHRRLLACRMVNYSPVPCRVKVNGEVDPLALLVAENAHRETVNPVEEARFYLRVLIELCENDVDQLCVKVRRRREYVEDRLILLQGHPNVVEALHKKRISIAVARELNKCSDPRRLLLLLDTAVNQGATARQVAEWRREGELLGPIGSADGIDDGTAANTTIAPPAFVMECLFCESAEDHSQMEMFYLHKPCKRIILKMLQRDGSAAAHVSD